MIVLIVYLFVSFVYTSFSLFRSWIKFKKKAEYYNQFMSIKEVVLTSKSAQLLKHKIFNLYTIPFIIFPFAVIFCATLFPLFIITAIKKFIFGKTKLEREADEESESVDKAKEFMKTEGDLNPIIDNGK